VLIDKPNVCETAIAGGLAQRIVYGHVPDSLRDCRLLSFDLGAFVAGTKRRVELEEGLKSFLQQVTQGGGDVVH
jgi:ATP-dependent Clp protease ATP-binding subunit ClpA